MIVPCDGPNQMIARIAQPTEGKEFRNGLIRSWTMTSVIGNQRGRNASTAPSVTAIITATTTRALLATTWPR